MAKPDRCAAAHAAREKLNSRRISGTACNVVGLDCLDYLTHFGGCLYLKNRRGKPYAVGVAARLMVLSVVPDLFSVTSATTPYGRVLPSPSPHGALRARKNSSDPVNQ